MRMLAYTTILLGLAVMLVSLLYLSVGTGVFGAAGGAGIMVVGLMMAVARKR